MQESQNPKLHLFITPMLIFLTAFIFMVIFFKTTTTHDSGQTPAPTTSWQVQSIDTMKYSRDIAREKLNDDNFTAVINKQVSQIAATGATHVAIAVPYDQEFIPFLKRWVDAARSNNLHVWFRGNFSGWEGWFGYSKITREEHIKKTVEFILDNSDLFQDGDIFTSCPECENGGPGDPRRTGDIEGYRSFLISEYQEVKNAFKITGKNIISNFYSMNGDVARAVMDPATTSALDGVVTVDHYVKSPQQLVSDLVALSRQSGGKVVLGEVGAPIPDIHGKMTEEEQSTWLETLLSEARKHPEIIGINYWVSYGGSTELWTPDGVAKKAVATLTKYFSPNVLKVILKDEVLNPVAGVSLTLNSTTIVTDNTGEADFILPILPAKLSVHAKDFKSGQIDVTSADTPLHITLESTSPSFLYSIKKAIIGVIK